ncbi:hypothetical protein Tco_0191118 [Tanacetum coccineum]
MLYIMCLSGSSCLRPTIYCPEVPPSLTTTWPDVSTIALIHTWPENVDDEDEDEVEGRGGGAPSSGPDYVPHVHGGFASPTLSHEVGESSAAARGDLYGFIDMVDVLWNRCSRGFRTMGITDTWDESDSHSPNDEEEEEEHPAPADSVLPVERLLALTTLPPSPLTPLSSPLPQIPSPPLPIPSLPPNSPTHIEIPKSCLPLRKRVRFASPTPSREARESSAAGTARQDRPTIAREDLYRFVDMVDIPPRCSTSRELDYGITDTWDDLVGAIDEIAPTTVEGVNQRVIDLAIIVEEKTTSMDRPVHRRLAVMIEREAKMAREAWGLSMDASDYARSDVMSLRTTVVAQSALISELQSADHRRQRVISELLASDHKRQVQLTKTLRLLKGLQTQMVELQRQHRPAKGPAQPDAPGEAGSSS